MRLSLLFLLLLILAIVEAKREYKRNYYGRNRVSLVQVYAVLPVYYFSMLNKYTATSIPH